MSNKMKDIRSEKEWTTRITEKHVGAKNFGIIEGKESPYRGEKHGRWKGGNWDYLKRQCLIRDNFTCKSCGLREIEIMEVDHIFSKKEAPELALSLSNLQTLCPNCHKRKTIKRYTRKGYRIIWKQRYITQNL